MNKKFFNFKVENGDFNEEPPAPKVDVNNIVSQQKNLRELLLAVEFGYLQNVKGYNLQQTLDEFIRFYVG